jgi:hypothetical protein
MGRVFGIIAEPDLVSQSGQSEAFQIASVVNAAPGIQESFRRFCDSMDVSLAGEIGVGIYHEEEHERVE